jgi:hypothetical protein
LPPIRRRDDIGILIPLICDIKVENGEFSWDNDLPPCSTVNFPRSPIGLHDSTQLTGTPLFESDRFVIKFHNLWTIEAPEDTPCSSRTPSIVSICPSRHSQDGSIATTIAMAGFIFRRDGATPISAAYCRKERRSLSAFQ